MKCTQGKTKKLTEAEINWKHPNFTALQIQITLPTSTWHFNNVNTTKTGIREQTNPSWPMTWQLQTKVWNAQCLLSRKSYYHLLSVSYAQQSKSHKLPSSFTILPSSFTLITMQPVSQPHVMLSPVGSLAQNCWKLGTHTNRNQLKTPSHSVHMQSKLNKPLSL